MAGLELKVRIDDLKAQAMLDALSEMDMREMFDEIGSQHVSEIHRRLKLSIDEDGNALIPSQRALAEGGKTLVNFGHLHDSYTYVVSLDGKGVEIGSNMIYSAIHQFGGEAGRNRSVTLAPRPVAGINADDQADIEDVVLSRIRRKLNS